nr:hypothetical protein CFP56_75364 [Quercus suber]
MPSFLCFTLIQSSTLMNCLLNSRTNYNPHKNPKRIVSHVHKHRQRLPEPTHAEVFGNILVYIIDLQ